MPTLIAIRGDDFVKRFTWETNGTPINMTGYTIEFIVALDGASAVTYTTTPQVTLTPLLGRIDILIEDAVTATWAVNRGTYRLRVRSSAGIKETLFRGSLAVT